MLAVGCALYSYQLIVNGGLGLTSPSSVICLVVGPLGFVTLLASLDGFRRKKDSQERLMGTSFFKLAIVLGLLTVATNSGLHNNRFLYPATWDYFVYRIDGAYGGFATSVARWFVGTTPVLQAIISTIYGVLIFGFYGVLALAVRKNEIARLNVWRTLVVPFGLAFLLYSLLPLSGPTYAFFSGQFPDNMPSPLGVAAAQVVIPPAYRNGMPSMHLTGAILVWMLSVGLRSRPAVSLSSILVMGTAIATLALGEHYLLDLIVAFPYAAFLGSTLIWPRRLVEKRSISLPIWISGLVFFTWLLLLRISPNWLAEAQGFVLFLSAISIGFPVVVFLGVFHSARSEKPKMIKLASSEPRGKFSAPAWVIAAFFVSGLAGLIYEVVYAKALAITFGSTALASYTVLATYMGGMAIGAWLGGYLADRAKKPLWTYAVCEAGIGVYAAFTPLLFEAIQKIYVYFSLDVDPGATWLTPFRLVLGAICLGVPTVLMGATLPLMFSHLRRLGISSSKAIAPLYASNVVGAALGSLIAGYFSLPAVGRNGGTYLAAAISLMIALYVLDKQKRNPIFPETDQKVTDRVSIDQLKLASSTFRAGLTALAILFVGGAVTLGLEVNSMHMLAIVAGNSVYAFGLMLATFLAGLGLGSMSGEYLMHRVTRLTLLAWAQCGIALAVALTAQLWDDLPSYFASFSLYPVPLSFSAREAIRALVCTVAMLPPAFFIGLSYPAAMSLATDWLSPKGGAKGLGFASALNTAGNILGVLLVGFFLLPEFGSRSTALTLSVIALTLGVAAILVNWRDNLLYRFQPVFWAKCLPAIFAIVALAFFPKSWNYDDLSTGSNVYFSAQNWGKVIDHAESVEGGLTTVAKNSQGVTILLTNGKFQGNNSTGGEMLAQESFALFPLLHTAKRDSALVIGYGTGMTARVLRDLKFNRIDIAETSRDIVKMADSHFSNINSSISTAKGVAMHYTDGRNFLLTQSKRFDVISIEITSIWFAGAANLYNRDFYALAKTRLGENGVLQQWIQLHHISETDLIYAIGSVRSEFKYVWIYVRGGQGIIVASNNESALDYPGEALIYEANKNADRELQPIQLRSHMVLSPSGVDNLISHFDPTMRSLVSTDQNLFLEHSTPKGNALGNVVQKNIQMLSQFESGAQSPDIR